MRTVRLETIECPSKMCKRFPIGRRDRNPRVFVSFSVLLPEGISAAAPSHSISVESPQECGNDCERTHEKENLEVLSRLGSLDCEITEASLLFSGGWTNPMELHCEAHIEIIPIVQNHRIPSKDTCSQILVNYKWVPPSN